MERGSYAEDAAGCFGAFTWPPRCYSCSFCRREFKSAQAVGERMNCQRKEKARPKQSSSEKLDHQYLCTCFHNPSDQSRNYPNQISHLLGRYNHNVKLKPDAREILT